jgi:hypothetical protein
VGPHCQTLDSGVSVLQYTPTLGSGKRKR